MTPASSALRTSSPVVIEPVESLPPMSLTFATPALPAVPYRGIEPFRYVDRDIFFAREDEVRKLVRLITMYRGVLLYGDSGTGKSSLINAGLIPAAIREGFAPERLRVRPHRGEEIKVERIRISDGTPVSYLPSLLADDLDAEEWFCISIEEFAERLANLPAGRRPLLIFDQFEELVTLFTVAPEPAALQQAQAAQAAITSALLKLLQHPDLPVKLLFVFREDYLAKVTRLFLLCPDLPDHHVRLTCPRLDSVSRIIRGPFEEFPGQFERELSPALSGKLFAALEQRSECGTVNLSEVQIVCRELWESSEPEALLEKKGVQGVLDGYLSDAIDRIPEGLRDAAVALLGRMLTGAGTRNIVSEDDLIQGFGEEEGSDPGLLKDALRVLEKDTKLVRREARNDVYFYEIVSEFLVPWIQRKRSKRQAEAERRKFEQERRKARRLVAGNVVFFGLAVLAVVLAILSMSAQRTADRARDEASRQKQLAHSRQLAAQALQYADDRVDLALLLGLEASRRGDENAGRNSLLSGLAASSNLVTLLRGHAAEVRSVAFSPDGTRLATAGLDGTIQIWNVQSGYPARQPLEGHHDVVYAVSFSPDGKTLASGSGDGTVALWDVASGRVVRSLTGHSDDDVYDVAFSPSDSRLLASGGADGAIQFWDVATGRRIGSLPAAHAGGVNALDFSPDGKRLASGGADRTVVLWNVAARSPITRLAGHRSAVFSVAFRPDGRGLASGLSTGEVFHWDLTRRPASNVSIAAHMNVVSALAFDPQSRRLVSGSLDKAISIWDVQTRKPLTHALEGYASSVYSIAFHPTGTWLASGFADGTVALWNVSGGRDGASAESRKTLAPSRVGTRLDSYLTVNSLAFSPAGDTIVAAEDFGLRAWNITTGESIPVVRTSATVSSLAFSPDGRALAAAGCGTWQNEMQRCTQGEIQFWDVAGWRPHGPPLPAHSDWMTVAFHPDGRTLASAGRDGQVVFWDVASRSQRAALSVSDQKISAVYAAAFSPDGRIFATGTDRGLILWDAATHRRLPEELDNDDLVMTIAFSRDGKLLAWAGRNSDISVWEIGSRRPRRLFSKHRSWVYSLAFSPDGLTLASASRDKHIVLWDVASGEPKGLPLAPSDRPVSTVAFSPDGRMASGSYDRGPLVLWDVGFDAVRAHACAIAGRNLTRDEWRRYFGDEPYQPTCAQGALKQADAYVLAGDRTSAQLAFEEAVGLGVAAGDAFVNNSICWWGSLDGAAATVMAACDRAVELAPANPLVRAQIRDSRGVARAVVGDFQGAIDDFTYFVSNWSAKEGRAQYVQRTEWIAALKARRNPFDANTLLALRNE